MPESTAGWMSILGNLAQGTVVPLVQEEILGRDAASELALVRERNYFASLNGSGAPNPNQAVDAASTGTELNTPSKFTWGNPFAFITQSRGRMIMAGILLLLVVWFFFFRRR